MEGSTVTSPKGWYVIYYGSLCWFDSTVGVQSIGVQHETIWKSLSTRQHMRFGGLHGGMLDITGLLRGSDARLALLGCLIAWRTKEYWWVGVIIKTQGDYEAFILKSKVINNLNQSPEQFTTEKCHHNIIKVIRLWFTLFLSELSYICLPCITVSNFFHK